MISCKVDPSNQPAKYKELWLEAETSIIYCGECGANINKGDRYLYISGVWEGDYASFVLCPLCGRVLLDLRDAGYCPYFGELWKGVAELEALGGELDLVLVSLPGVDAKFPLAGWVPEWISAIGGHWSNGHILLPGTPNPRIVKGEVWLDRRQAMQDEIDRSAAALRWAKTAQKLIIDAPLTPKSPVLVSRLDGPDYMVQGRYLALALHTLPGCSFHLKYSTDFLRRHVIVAYPDGTFAGLIQRMAPGDGEVERIKATGLSIDLEAA